MVSGKASINRRVPLYDRTIIEMAWITTALISSGITMLGLGLLGTHRPYGFWLAIWCGLDLCRLTFRALVLAIRETRQQPPPLSDTARGR